MQYNIDFVFCLKHKFGRTWYKNGKKHREDGPAVEKLNGKNEWWINGEQISKPMEDSHD